MKYILKTKEKIKENYTFNLLKDRGIFSESEINWPSWYLNPTEENLCSSIMLDHMNEGFEMFKHHLENGSKIRFYVDCDVDGFTSSALFINYINEYLIDKYPIEVSYHIPTGKEHGLRNVMDELLDEKICDLIILPDSSSNDYDEHKALKEMGYDILVLDHHDAEKYSENAIVINNQLSVDYQNKSASGVGIVYKFLQFCDAMIGIDNGAEKFIDLVALGEISDMMSMQTPENRYICEKGLSNITNILFKEIIKKQCYSMFGIAADAWRDSYLTDGSVTQIKVAFYVTPLINALIRVGTQSEKELLFHGLINGNEMIDSTKRGCKGEKETVAEQATRNCVNARSRQNREKDKAIESLDIQIIENCLDENKILILNADDLDVSSSLTGLIAMGIAAKYKKPTMLGRICPDGCLKGSIRGRAESELKDFKGFLKDSELMEFVEGHANAAGFSLNAADIDKLCSYANEKLANINFNEGFYEADFVVEGNYSDLPRLVYELGDAAPIWGQGNEEPVIVVEHLTIPRHAIQVIGSKGDTVKFAFNGVTYMIFKGSDIIEQLNMISDNENITITCAGRANLNHWGGKTIPQIYIDEIDINVGTIYDF